jgi:hypothetical protein
MKNKELYDKMMEDENKEWEKKMSDLTQHFEQIENELVEKQKKEREDLIAELDRTLPTKIKPSSTLLNQKQIQQNLVKQKKYNEANDMKESIEKLEAEEEKKWTKQRSDKIGTQEAQLMQKHKKEREAHAKRAKTAMQELEKEMSKKVSQLTQTYNNTRKQTETAQKIEVAQLTKAEKKGSPVGTSIMNGAGSQENSPAKESKDS